MPTLTTADGVEIFYRDRGVGQPVMFHHGWPLSADEWDPQLHFFLQRGYRVIAHDRRGHGRSSHVGQGHDLDHYAADTAALVVHLGLHDVIHVGHCVGGGEVVRYIARHGAGRVAKAVLIGAVPPRLLRTDVNPLGLPLEVFDGFREGVAVNRSQFYLDVAAGPFYGFNRPGARVSQGVVWNWWRQGMAGDAKAHHDGIRALSETDFTADLRAIDVPTLVLHGGDDQIVPCAASAELAAPLLPRGTLKVYPGFSHGMCTVNPDAINADLLDFITS